MIPLIAKMMSKAVILAALVAMAQAKDGTSPSTTEPHILATPEL